MLSPLLAEYKKVLRRTSSMTNLKYKNPFFLSSSMLITSVWIRKSTTKYITMSPMASMNIKINTKICLRMTLYREGKNPRNRLTKVPPIRAMNTKRSVNEMVMFH